MGRIIIIFLAVLMTPVIVLSPEAKAQQANFRQTQDAAMAAAAGPEFQRTGYATVGKSAPRLKRRQSSGPFSPQPYVIPKGEGDAYVPPPLKTNFGKTPSTLNLSGNDNMQEPQSDKTNYGEKLEARSRAIFPSGPESERQRWMADQEQRYIANEINSAKPLLYPVSGR